ncbi:MAG: hypothetical protein J0M11_12190 [Anaerolineae bacterium]|nr:hypothetical protein [Anaerolineae bacterium]
MSHITVKQIYLAAIIVFVLTACVSQQEMTAPEIVASPTSTLAPSPTSTPTVSLSPQPTKVGGSSGLIISDREGGMGRYIGVSNVESGEEKILISEEELRDLLPEDRFTDSVHFSEDYEPTLEMYLSPDLRKIYTFVCVKLDARLRCLYEYYIYDIQKKTLVQLQVPADLIGVEWEWSPDSVRLVGAGWMYDTMNILGRRYTMFYVINNDGTNIKPLIPVSSFFGTNFAWNWDGNSFYPLTYYTNFQAVDLENAGVENIAINGLKTDDIIECLAFSPANEKVVFAVIRETQEGYYWLYSANSDFSNATLVSEFGTQLRFGCELTWSPNGEFIRLNLPYQASEYESLYEPLDMVFDVQSWTSVEIPKDPRTYHEWKKSGDFENPYIFICGWAPDGGLVYSKETVNILNLSNSAEVVLEELVGCPKLWLQEELPYELAEGYSILDACHPGDGIVDEPDATPFLSYFDIQEINSSLEGEILTVEIKLKAISDDLSVYMNTDSDFLNGWDVEIDLDNNVLSGAYFSGMEYVFSVYVWNGSDGKSPEVKGILKKHIASGQDFLEYSRAGKIEVELIPETQTIKLTGKVPGITENSRLVFRSKIIEIRGDFPFITGDEICK